jgi:hypothetical protein
MGIEQIRMNQTKALPPVPQFNWSQMESGSARSYEFPVAGQKINKTGMVRSLWRSEKKIPPQDPGTKNRNPGHPAMSPPNRCASGSHRDEEWIYGRETLSL